MRTKYFGAVVMALLGLAILMSAAVADEIAYDIQTPTVIASDDQGSRYLARPEVSFPDTAMVIDKAILELWVEPQTEDTVTYVSVRVYPITTDWNVDAVSWISPWTNPGGDFDDVFYAEYAIGSIGAQEIQIDMTDLCMRWADARLPYYGFLVGVSESSLAPVQFLNGPDGNWPFATLRISYTSIPE